MRLTPPQKKNFGKPWQVKVRVDNEATEFSQQNAYFFAEMSEICYKTEGEVKLFLESNDFWGSGVTAGDNFEWFEVQR